MIMLIIVAAIVLGIYVLVESLGGAMKLNFNLAVNPTDANVQKIAEAIAFAEGFYVAGSRPARNHNPGDMTADLVGRGIGKDGPFVVYETDVDGWANLYAQINKWLSGSSSHATSDSTISDISSFYTANDQAAWATNVANQLGVSIDTPIGKVV